VWRRSARPVRQPRLEPGRAIAALRHLLDHPRASDSDILAIAGPPWSVSGCAVTRDLNALAAGHQIMLRQTGQISLTGNPIPEPGRIPKPASGAGPTATVSPISPETVELG
jgi:hypothetical protein